MHSNKASRCFFVKRILHGKCNKKLASLNQDINTELTSFMLLKHRTCANIYHRSILSIDELKEINK
jgi:hypothetical protein